MIAIRTSHGRSIRGAAGCRQQRGVVLIIALVVMVALILAGIALIRSTDTATTAGGNLALQQAAISAVDRSVEQAVHALFDTSWIPDRLNNNLGQNYFASVERNVDGSVKETPTVLQEPFSESAFTAAGLSTTLVGADDAGHRSFYVIERMCAAAGQATGSNCNLSSGSFGADPGTQHYRGLVRPGDAYYRVTIRVEGPRNTVSYAQAILK
jgi:Tfp pilus assembly protein PilX